MIHTDAELEAYTEALFELTALDEPSPAEDDAIELLALLVESYETVKYPIPVADGRAVVRFLMERQGLRQRDLIPEFGTESAVSMFLAGKRRLTVKQVRRLGERFRLPVDVFLASGTMHE